MLIAGPGDGVTVVVIVGVGVAVGVGEEVLDVVQPATDIEATTSNRIAIAVIDLNCIMGHL